MKPRSRTVVVAVALSACLGLTACGGSGGSAASPSDSGSSAATQSTLTVFAAASLNKTFTELAKTFESEHPGVKVTFNFGGSSDLVTQLTHGAPGDVFAAANESTMKKAVDANIVEGSPIPFASNTLTIVTAAGNPKKITDLKNLATQSTAGVKVVVCAPPVPCGAATEKVEKASGATIKAVSEEQSVTDVLGKVTSGQADAGLVYVTDAKSAGDKVATVDFPEAASAVNLYPIAVMKSAKDPATAKAFVDFIAGPEGTKALAAAGFAAP